MVKFVESDATGLPLKRKQVAQACISCRKRKKRCIHEGLVVAEDNGAVQDSVSPTRLAAGHHTFSAGESTTARFTPSDPRPQHPSPSQESRAANRFIGDLNPQHFFIEATSPYSNRDISVRAGVGIWQPKASHDGREPAASGNSCPGPWRTMHDILISHVHSKCLPCVPPTVDWHALRDIYFDKLDPLYPVISHATARSDDLSPSSVVVKQVICLAAATKPDAVSHFRLMPYGPLLSRSDFTASLAAAIHATIESGLVTDRVLLIRILVLYAMYMQPTCPEEADLPTLVFSRATHQLFTLGLHLPTPAADDDFDQIQSLFCCTWALDRLNAAFYGRACIIHERDIGWDLDACIRSQSPPFRLFLMVTRLLDSVIGLYRPSQKLTEEPLFIDLPIMEQMIIDAGATKVASPLLATVEIFYHAVAILSCRFPQGGSHVQSALPSRATNSRRSLSADRITELFRDEFPGQLSYVPTIPYAVSLSLSVGYRKMRYSQIPMFRKRGKRSFAANTALLKELGEMFWSARTMAGMAEQVLQEMDKAAASIAQESNENGGREDSSNSQGDDMPEETPKPMPRGLPMASVPLDNGNGDMPIFPSPPEVDVWGHLDPNFNLGPIDAAIQGNLDFGTSSNWFDWQQQSWGYVE